MHILMPVTTLQLYQLAKLQHCSTIYVLMDALPQTESSVNPNWTSNIVNSNFANITGLKSGSQDGSQKELIQSSRLSIINMHSDKVRVSEVYTICMYQRKLLLPV